jgi:hypothetical protein
MRGDFELLLMLKEAPIKPMSRLRSAPIDTDARTEK